MYHFCSYFIYLICPISVPCIANHLKLSMLGQVDVEVDGAAEHRQQVGHLAHVSDPQGPEDNRLLLCASLHDLPYVGHPPHTVAGYEHYTVQLALLSHITTTQPTRHNSQASLGVSHLPGLLLGGWLERRVLSQGFYSKFLVFILKE